MKELVLSPVSNKRLISNLLSSSTPKENENFILKGSREFKSRSNDVFGQLKTLEQSHEAWICENNTHEPIEEDPHLVKTESSMRLESTSKSSNANVSSSNESFVEKKNKEPCDVFKKPQFTGIKKRKINAAKSYLKYGKKWTKYSLKDIPLCSNAANASIALSFINDLRKRKTSLKEESEECNQILFSKPRTCHASSSSFPSSMDATSSVRLTSVKKFQKIPDTIKLSHLENDSD